MSSTAPRRSLGPGYVPALPDVAVRFLNRESVVRGTVTFLVILLLMRAVGQRESGGLGITDVLLVVLVAEAAGPGLQGKASSVADGVVLVVTMLFWSVVVDALAYRFPKFGHVLKARPKPLIDQGNWIDG